MLQAPSEPAKSDVDKDSSVKQIYFFHSVSFMIKFYA